MGHENDFRPTRGEVAAAIGCPGLDENRPALRRAADIERPAHGKPLAVVIDGPHQSGIGKSRRFGIQDEGAVAPAIPKLAGDIEKFVGPVVALVARELVLQPEIGGLRLLERGDDVPCRAAAAQMVERRHGAGDGEGMEIGGRYRAREAKIFGRSGHGRENEQRIEPQRTERAIAQLAVELALIPVRNCQNVGKENEIEAAVFEDAAHVAVVFQRQQVAVGSRVAPSPVMAGNGPGHDEGRQVHLSLFHWPAPVWASSPGVRPGEPVGRKFRLSGRQRP